MSPPQTLIESELTAEKCASCQSRAMEANERPSTTEPNKQMVESAYKHFPTKWEFKQQG